MKSTIYVIAINSRAMKISQSVLKSHQELVANQYFTPLPTHFKTRLIKNSFLVLKIGITRKCFIGVPMPKTAWVQEWIGLWRPTNIKD